jgi:putative aldouronate transport system permease protein
MGVSYFAGPWVGFSKFIEFFQQTTSMLAIRNTIAISLIKLVFGFFIPVVFALLLNEVRNRYVLKSVQTISYLPHFLSWVITISIFGRLLSFDGGLINNVIEFFGGKSINFLGSTEYVYAISFFTEIWKETGWGAIIYFAALSSIDTALYEAAAIDGCSKFRRIWHISLPGIKSTIMIILILSAGGIFNSNFDQMYLLQNGGNIEAARVVDTYIYEKMMSYPFDYSAATAMGLMKSLLNIALLIGVNAIVKKFSEDSIF